MFVNALLSEGVRATTIMPAPEGASILTCFLPGLRVQPASSSSFTNRDTAGLTTRS